MSTRGSYREVKWTGREADHSPPCIAEVKECVDLYLHSPDTSSWRDAKLKHRDNFAFTNKMDALKETNIQLQWSDYTDWLNIVTWVIKYSIIE
jgi:hypothetical protein